jgi:hypothetical protein
VTTTLDASSAPIPPPPRAPPSISWARLAPTLVAAIFSAAYVIAAPPSLDLAAHLYRAHLFSQEGFGIWDNYWYGGHHIIGYSVLFPAISAALTPQIAAAVAAVATAALFEPLARRHFGSTALLGSLLFGAAVTIDLYTGRLAFAFGVLPALGAIVALDAGAGIPAAALALLSALCSPVAALFAAVVAAAYAIAALSSERRVTPALPAVGVVVAALAPVGLLPRRAVRLRVGIAVYAVAAVVVFFVPTPVGSNVARMGTLLAAPLAALWWPPRHRALLAIALAPLLYVGWEPPVHDVVSASGQPSTSARYYQPLLRFLADQAGGRKGAFRTEIPFTEFHWESDIVASRFPIARGWERQLDVADNSVFYRGQLTVGAYRTWLHMNAIRYVAASDAKLDYSGVAETRLIDSGLPYLQLVMRSAHWRVYAVAHPTPLAQGVARVTAMGPDSVTLQARSAGVAIVHVHFTPYWKLTGTRGPTGCVAPDGTATRLTLRRPGQIRLVTSFSLARIGAHSPRCS